MTVPCATAKIRAEIGHASAIISTVQSPVSTVCGHRTRSARSLNKGGRCTRNDRMRDCADPVHNCSNATFKEENRIMRLQ